MNIMPIKARGCMMIELIAGMSAWSEYYAEAVRNNPTSLFAPAALYTKEEYNVAIYLE